MTTGSQTEMFWLHFWELPHPRPSLFTVTDFILLSNLRWRWFVLAYNLTSDFLHRQSVDEMIRE